MDSIREFQECIADEDEKMVHNNKPKGVHALKNFHKLLKFVFSQQFLIGDSNCNDCILLRFVSLCQVSSKRDNMFLPLHEMTHNCAIFQFLIKTWVVLSVKGTFTPSRGHKDSPIFADNNAAAEYISILKLSTGNTSYHLLCQEYALAK